MELRVLQVKDEAWWKNCLTVTLNGQSRKVGCNKDAAQEGKVVYLLANKGTCNQIKVDVATYKLTDGGQTCIARKNMSPPQMCQGPYPPESSPDQVRTMSFSNDREFFKEYNHSNGNTKNPLIQLDPSFSWSKMLQDFVTFRSQGVNGWTRVFFEDKSASDLANTKANPAAWQTYGIDYNDYIFDIMAENVKFEIEGSSLTCAMQ